MKYVLGHTQRGRTTSDATRARLSARANQLGLRPIVTREMRSAIAKRRVGPLSPRWKGGVTKERQSRKHLLWAQDVKKRDNYTCQICGHREYRHMHAHHIWSFAEFPDKRYDLDNGVTLCAACHRTKGVHKTPITLIDLLFDQAS